jgi:hypothetical protein
MLGTDQGKISHIESGRIGVSEERIRKLATFYACHDQALLDALCTIAREHRGQYWWDEYRGIIAPGPLNVAELEYHSVAMKAVHTVSFPGLLQIPDYARALFRGVFHPELTPEEIDTRTEFRMRRKVVFEREDPPPFDVFIHEAALRMRFGGRHVVRAQLRYLMDAGEWPNVTVRVIPFTNEEFFEATQPVFYSTGVVPQLDTVQYDTPRGGGFLDSTAELEGYRAFFDRAGKVSLSAEESRQLIHHIAREL